MKIYNLILLNFYFLQLISLLFGMNPGEGHSGSQPGGLYTGEGSGSQQPRVMYPGEGSGSQPGGMYPGEGSGTQQPIEEDEFTKLCRQILPLLERVGDHKILQTIPPRQINDPDRVEAITNVRKQYYNLVYAHIELLRYNNDINEHINSLLKYLHQNLNNPNFEQEKQDKTRLKNELEKSRQINENLKIRLIDDMEELYEYVQILYNGNQPTRNLAYGTVGHGQHGQEQPIQSHRGRGQRGQSRRGQGQRGRGRRGGRRGYNPYK